MSDGLDQMQHYTQRVWINKHWSWICNLFTQVYYQLMQVMSKPQHSTWN